MRSYALLATGVCAVVALTGAGVAAATSFKPARPPASAWAAPAHDEPAPEPAGILEAVTGGVLERATTLRYPGADYVKVHFSRLQLDPGDTVTVSDASGGEIHRYTAAQLRDADNWTMSVSGESATVSVERAGADRLGIRSKLAGLGVTVDRVARGQTPTERAEAEARRKAAAAAQRHAESICGHDEKQDAVCYKSADPVAYANAKPVARILINGVELCTAWRLGPNNRMMTNAHCFTTTREARNTEVWFNYECAQCGGGPTLRPVKVMADQVIATHDVLDYTLFTVRNFDAIARFGYLQLDDRAPVRGEELYIPQHPRGMPTVITTHDTSERSGNCAVANPAYDGYDVDTDMSYYCDTDGGSSGSPVISRRTNKVIALHHFGGCPNSGVRMDHIAADIRGLL
ncbi:trypsin-like peptidase domain-containing protein [Dactylosporangium aurantiacum]|uniref:Trypsin-like peptidase domain-containing protein n=1 Tax=Dactylosporangium aurantiacum TaxID=35754 RepID=A0A9Q9IJ86_9ACTN|nr:serine protease [Dactylosporangium aurantiacum]MDG6100792.1 serine protease [Dactylosporangium aurantiacum]UWZ55145.1 trypsin-like peptidase domain-containing protein [Dactylosporangium aurantiacum]